MISIDTNYLVRFFTRDVESQFQEAKEIIADDNVDKYVSPIVVAETIYILENHYKLGKEEVILALSSLFSVGHIKTANFLKKALGIYMEESISFYDSVIVAEAIESNFQLKTFDSKLNKVFKTHIASS